MAYSGPGAGRVLSVPFADRSVRAQRRAFATLAVGVALVVFAVLWAAVGPSIAAVLAAVGSAGAAYAGSVLLACRAYGHAVECGSRPFCECERCGRPMDDR
jgi:cytochrome c biogenesis protein CcdA